MIYKRPETRFARPQPLFRVLALSYIGHGPDELHDLSVAVQNRMPYGVERFPRAGWENNAFFHFIIGLLLNRSRNRFLPMFGFLPPKAVHAFFPGGRLANFESVNAIPFVREVQGFLARNVPDETAGVRQLLRFGQVPFV